MLLRESGNSSRREKSTNLTFDLGCANSSMPWLLNRFLFESTGANTIFFFAIISEHVGSKSLQVENPY